jgi:hypothetical protein
MLATIPHILNMDWLQGCRTESSRRLGSRTEARKWHKEFNPSKVCNHECANHNKVELYEKLTTDSYDSFV